MGRYHTAEPSVVQVGELVAVRVVTVVLDQPCDDPTCERTHAVYPVSEAEPSEGSAS